MCDAVSLGMFEISLCRGVILGMTLGHCSIISVVLITWIFLVMSMIQNLQIDKWFCCLRLL